MNKLYSFSLVVVVLIFSACSKEPEVKKHHINKKSTILKPKHLSKILHVEKKQKIKQVKVKEYEEPVLDLSTFPQYARAYTNNIKNHSSLVHVQTTYNEKYFEPWTYTKPPYRCKDILWPFLSYTYDKSYGENLRKIHQEWFVQMKDLGNFDKFASLNKKAISLSYLNVRNFPTNKPVFKDPNQAGEGFPFDYMQNSGVHANEPLFVSHLSKDGRWAYIITAYVTGWVELKDIAYLSDDVATSWKNAQQIKITDEFYPIKDLKGNFVFQSRVGMRLPLISIQKDYYIVLAITVNKNHLASYSQVKIPFTVAKENTLKLNKDNMSHIVDLMLQSKYGWGGLYEQRDCSSMLRDLFAPFGIWLPRNSSQQGKMGKVISLANLDLDHKREKIIQEAIPFETLFYKKGHILLYLGLYDGRITVLHDVWGVRTLEDGVEGRKVIGKTVVSSLTLGKEQKNYYGKNGLLENILSMNIITKVGQVNTCP